MFFILSAILSRRVGGLGMRSVATSAAKTVAASAVGGAVAFGLLLITGTTDGLVFAFIQLIIAGSIGVVVAYGGCILLRVDGADAVKRLVKKLLRRR